MAIANPEFQAVYQRESGANVKIIALGPKNAVGVDAKGKFYLFGLDGFGSGATGNLKKKLPAQEGK